MGLPGLDGVPGFPGLKGKGELKTNPKIIGLIKERFFVQDLL